MENIKGMKTCSVCRRDFPLLIEEHYVARGNEPGGISKALSGDETPLYDAIDCPYCGCQNTLQPRKRIYTFEDCPCDYGICDECDCGKGENSDGAE